MVIYIYTYLVENVKFVDDGREFYLVKSFEVVVSCLVRRLCRFLMSFSLGSLLRLFFIFGLFFYLVECICFIRFFCKMVVK